MKANERKASDEASASSALIEDVGAELRGAIFASGGLKRPDLCGAVRGWTTFAAVDPSEAQGLDSVIHIGPTTVGIDTLFGLNGNIPEAFLGGCGIPDSVIVNRSAFVVALQPTQFYSSFISYSTRDEEFAKLLHARMTEEQLRVWFAPEDMRGGREFTEQIKTAIRVHDKLLLVLSKASMASHWVRHEITQAIEREDREKRKVLFPIGLAPYRTIKAWSAFDPKTGKDVAERVRAFHIPDFSTWKDRHSFEKAFQGLLRDLAAEKPTDTAAPASASLRRKKPA